VRMRTAAALVWMRALAELVHTRPKGEQCGGADANGEDKISLSFLEKPCMPMRGAGLWVGL
jgi:hypothetical protein